MAGQKDAEASRPALYPGQVVIGQDLDHLAGLYRRPVGLIDLEVLARRAGQEDRQSLAGQALGRPDPPRGQAQNQDLLDQGSLRGREIGLSAQDFAYGHRLLAPCHEIEAGQGLAAGLSQDFSHVHGPRCRAGGEEADLR